MKVEVINYQDNWQAVKDAAMRTIGSDSGKYPSDAWKRNILLAEHSPIRLIELTVSIKGIPYYSVMHLVRHKIGIEHWVSTQRTDRTGVNRNELRQDALVDYTFRANAQAFITISRKRLCTQADKTTRAVWKAVIEAISEVEPVLASVCHHFQKKILQKKESRSGNPQISRPAIFQRIFKTKKSGAPRARPHMMIIVLTCGRKFSAPESQLDLTIMATP